MPLSLPATVKAQLEGQRVRCIPLIEMQFVSGTKRYFSGRGVLNAGGLDWLGVDKLLTLDLGMYSVNGAAEQFSLALSGVDAEFLAKARAEMADLLNRRLVVHLQFFDAAGAMLDQPVPLRAGRMRGLRFDAQGVGVRTVTLNCESIFAARGRPPATFLNDLEQVRRYGVTGAGLKWLPVLQNKTVTWPK